MAADPVDTQTTSAQINAYLNTLSEKYLGNNLFIVSGTNTGYVTAGVTAIAPYGNLSNRYYPTVVTLPENSTNLKTRDELGGYFTPSNLGVSLYLTKNITYSLDTTAISAGNTYHFIDPTRFDKGRGLTQKDQGNIINHYIDLNWMKATAISDQFDGNIINADTYQKFVPYQSAYETNKADSNGINNANGGFEFWTGTTKNTWDENNKANKLNDLKYYDLQGRITNLIYTAGKELYYWGTDVFGNQYAHYKAIVTPRSLYNSSRSNGTLWVKTIDSTINTGPSALSLIFDSYKNNSTIYSQLTSNNIINFEVFFDTYVIQLSSTVLYEKITFSYDNYTIQKSLQNFLPLNIGITDSKALSTSYMHILVGTPGPTAMTYYGGNWYDDATKTITICTLLSTTLSGGPDSFVDTGGLSSLIVPVLYSIDLNKSGERTRIFPNNFSPLSAFFEYVYPLSAGQGTEINYMEAPVFSYNEDTGLYMTTFLSFS
jgi:hypothetical protein